MPGLGRWVRPGHPRWAELQQHINKFDSFTTKELRLYAQSYVRAGGGSKKGKANTDTALLDRAEAHGNDFLSSQGNDDFLVAITAHGHVAVVAAAVVALQQRQRLRQLLQPVQAVRALEHAFAAVPLGKQRERGVEVSLVHLANSFHRDRGRTGVLLDV